MFTLSNRTRNKGESAHTLACKLMELVKLAYLDFDDLTRCTLAKDYFFRGLKPEFSDPKNVPDPKNDF